MRSSAPILFAVLFVLAATCVLADEPGKPAVLHVPNGFIVECVADQSVVRYPMFAAFDDRGRLFVAESSGLDLYKEITAATRKCRVRMLEDRDGDGTFETSKVFADKLVFPMGLVWRNGKLYVADPPDLVTYEDHDDDGVGDRRSVILSGFGHRDNGSLHGLTFGPDGWLYMTMGEPDGYKLKRADGSFLEGTSGALIRCRPDGTDPEVVSRGFVNLVEVAFTPRGDAIGTDNWFQHPNDGYRDALVHLVPGGLFPYAADTGTRFPVTGDPLPSVALFPAVALSGICTYQGAVFPAAMQGNFFTAQHNSRKIARHVLTPNGSTFRAESFDFVTTDDPDFHPSDVLESADGSLIVVDTGAWYVQHCPTGRIRSSPSTGGIYRVRANNASTPQDPWGLAIDWKSAPSERLGELLADRRPAVRDRAQQTLTARGTDAIPSLRAVLISKAPTIAKQHAIWSLAGIDDLEARQALCPPLVQSDHDVVVTAARALGMCGKGIGRQTLARLLEHHSPEVRLAAAEALARVGWERSLEPLWNALRADPDRFLEHSIVHAIHHLASANDLEAALGDEHPRVQRAALRLLDQPPRPAGALRAEVVFARATSADADLRRAATEILSRHPEWADEAVKLLSGWLAKDRPSDEERIGLRNVILGLQRSSGVQELVAAAIVNRDGKSSPVQRTHLLAVLAESTLGTLPRGWVEALSTSLADADDGVRRQGLKTAAVLQVPELDDQLSKIADDDSQPADARRDALRAVIRRRSKPSPAVLTFLMNEFRDEERPIDRLAAAELLRECQLGEGELREVLAMSRDEPLIAPAFWLPTIKRSTASNVQLLLLDYISGSLENGWRPTDDELSELLKTLPDEHGDKAQGVRQLHRQSIEGQRARLQTFGPALSGGDPSRGRAVFFGKKATCSVCHRVGGEGGQVGPDLSKAGAIRSGRDLLESIVLPSSTIAQGYDAYLITMHDGRSTTGVLARDVEEVIVLRDSSGAEARIRRDQIAGMSRASTSVMPEGLERSLGPDDLRDLLAFLQSLK